MNVKWLKVSLGYFLIIAILGTLIRFGFFSGYFPINYKFILHSHSHLAFLGWIYPVLFIAITNNFIEKEQIIKGKYHLQFFITQIILAGMFFSFLMQGYGTVSIIFSTIFQFLTYWFAFRFFKDYKKTTLDKKFNYSVKFIKTGLTALVISSLGTWGLAVIGAKGMAGTDIYDEAIYFYLHFQYNGWFTFTILGLLMSLIEKNHFAFSKKYTDYSYKLLSLSLFPAYFLSVLGKEHNSLITLIAFTAGAIQLIGTAYFSSMLFEIRKDLIKLFKGYIKPLMAISATAFLAKTILQLMSTFPILTGMAFNNRFVVIAYIHMVFIGFISLFLFGYLSHMGWYNLNSKIAKVGVSLLVTGFSVTELLLITPAFNLLIPDFAFLIFLFSTFMVTGITLFIAGQFIPEKEKQQTAELPALKIVLKKKVYSK